MIGWDIGFNRRTCKSAQQIASQDDTARQQQTTEDDMSVFARLPQDAWARAETDLGLIGWPLPLTRQAALGRATANNQQRTATNN